MNNVQTATEKKLWSDLGFQYSLRNFDVFNMKIVLRAYGLPFDNEDATAMVIDGRAQILADGGTL